MTQKIWFVATCHQKTNVDVLQELVYVTGEDMLTKLLFRDDNDNTDHGNKTVHSEVSKDSLQSTTQLPIEWIEHSTHG